MADRRRCIVKSCPITGKDGTKIYYFPVDKGGFRRNAWLNSIGRDNLKTGMLVNNYAGVCAHHFGPEDYAPGWNVLPDGTIKHNLKRTAVPKYNLNTGIGELQDASGNADSAPGINLNQPESQLVEPDPDVDSDTSTNFDEDEDEPLELIRQKIEKRRDSQLLTQSSQQASQSQSMNSLGGDGAAGASTSGTTGMEPPQRIRIVRNPRTVLTGEEHANMIASSIKTMLVMSKNDDFREEVFHILGVSNSYDAENVLKNKVLKLLNLPQTPAEPTLEEFFLSRDPNSQASPTIDLVDEGIDDDDEDARSVSLLEIDEDESQAVAGLSRLVTKPVARQTDPADEVEDSRSLSLLEICDDNSQSVAGPSRLPIKPVAFRVTAPETQQSNLVNDIDPVRVEPEQRMEDLRNDLTESSWRSAFKPYPRVEHASEKYESQEFQSQVFQRSLDPQSQAAVATLKELVWTPDPNSQSSASTVIDLTEDRDNGEGNSVSLLENSVEISSSQAVGSQLPTNGFALRVTAPESQQTNLTSGFSRSQLSVHEPSQTTSTASPPEVLEIRSPVTDPAPTPRQPPAQPAQVSREDMMSVLRQAIAAKKRKLAMEQQNQQ